MRLTVAFCSRRPNHLNICFHIAVLTWFSKKRSLVIGISSAGGGVGGICWSFLARGFISRHSYHWALWTTACISAVLNLVAILLIKERSTPGQQHVKKHGSFREAFGMFKNPKFATLYFASALSVFGSVYYMFMSRKWASLFPSDQVFGTIFLRSDVRTDRIESVSAHRSHSLRRH